MNYENDWRGSKPEKEWTNLVNGCSSYPDFSISATLGVLEAGNFVAGISHPIFTNALHHLIQMTCWSGASTDWEHIIEIFYQFDPNGPETCDWINRHLNIKRRYKRRELKYMRTHLGWSDYFIDVRSRSTETIDPSKKMDKPQQCVAVLRHRRTFVLQECIYIHCDLLSDRVPATGNVGSVPINRQCITLEIPKFDTRAVNLLHMGMQRFLSRLFQFAADVKILPPINNGLASRMDSQCEGMDECLPLLHDFRANSEYELEGRFGELKVVLVPEPHYEFVSGVSREKFFSVIKWLEKYQDWSNRDSSTWADSTDIFWGNLRGTKTRETTMNGSPLTYVVKKPVRAVNLRCPERRQSIRLSLKKEISVSPKERPLTPATSYRVKRRRSFIYHNTFRYDFTIIGSGETEEAAILFKNGKQYEIELEVMRTLSTVHDRPAARLMLSMFKKLAQILDKDEAEPCTLQVAHNNLALYDL